MTLLLREPRGQVVPGNVQDDDTYRGAPPAQQVTVGALERRAGNPADSPAAIRWSIHVPATRNQGQRSSSVSSAPDRILAMLAAGCSTSPSLKAKPRPLVEQAGPVDFPLPDTPPRITIMH